MNKVMLFLGLVILNIAVWLAKQSELGFYDVFVWTSFIIILTYFVFRAAITSK